MKVNAHPSTSTCIVNNSPHDCGVAMRKLFFIYIRCGAKDEIERLLERRDVTVTVKNEDGVSALAYSLAVGNPDIAKLLMRWGARR